MMKVVMLLVFIAMLTLSCDAIQYLFTSPQYTIQEDGTTNVDVTLQRTGDTPGDTSELTTTTEVVLDTVCPADCPLMAGTNLAVEGTSASGGDYTIDTKTLTFPPGDIPQTVSITVHDDNDEEFREYFCLSVMDPAVRGSQWSTMIVIPWNDNCIQHFSDLDEGTDATSIGYFIENPLTAGFGYVGPWENTEKPITLKITAEPTPGGSGNDINIFLTDRVNTLDTNVAWYGIHIDDSEADDASHITFAGTKPATYIVEGESGDGIGATVIGTPEAETGYISDTVPVTFELSYESGKIILGSIVGTTGGTPLNINHLFVSAAHNDYAQWDICGMDPKKLPRVGASASGFTNKFGPEKAIDDVLWDTSCFFSEPDSAGDNWMKIDLGREFDVSHVIIIPVPGTVTDEVDPDSMNNARVYVGSCREDDITSNNVCSGDIGDVSDYEASGTQDSLIEVKCPAGTYGRYVYILPASDADQLFFCDVTVFGDDVPIDEETKVFFTNEDMSVDENVSTGDVTLSLTRTGAGRTCTYVDYYTDQSQGDFTAILPGAAKEIKISGSGDTQSDTVTVQITDDDICESTESFSVYLANIDGGILDTHCSATIEINDDDAVTHSISTTTTSINEGNGPLNIQVLRTGDGIEQPGSATLKLSDGDATSADYVNSDQVIQFTETTNTQNAQVIIKDDECFEHQETFEATLDYLEPDVCSGVGAGLPLTMTITDNDSKFEWDIATDVVLTLDEGSGSTTIDIIREGTVQTKDVEIVVNYDTSDSSDFSINPSSNLVTFLPLDSSQPITINIDDDSEVERDESFTLTLRDPLGDDCPNGNRGEDHQLHIRIRDNDGVYNWERTSYNAVENDVNVLVDVCLTRTGDLTDYRDVLISTETTAILDSDITDIQRIPFQEGESRACGQIQVIGDNIVESTETFNLRITPGQDDINIGSQQTAVLTIYDDDARVGWEEPSYVFSEAAGSSATVYISHSGNSSAVSVSSSPVTATSGVDFTPVSISFTIDAATTSYPLQLQIFNDALDEPSESFTLTLTATDSDSITRAETTITIIDDDPTPTLPPTTPAPTTGLNGGAIAGIVIGAIVGGLILAILIPVSCWLCLRRGRLASASDIGLSPFAPKQVPQQGQLVPLGFGGNAFGVPGYGYGYPNNGVGYPNNGLGLPINGFGYDNTFGNASYDTNPYGFGYP